MIKGKTIDNFNSKDVVDTYDELPLWAAPFGLKLLDKIEYKMNIKVLDIGCGVGFPSLEIAQRLGNSSKVYGLDLWEAALEKGRYKASIYDISNVEFICGDANNIPFKNSVFDTVVSNNGVNNTGDEVKTIAESFRVLKTGGQFVFTVNLPGTMKEFYDVYKEALLELNLQKLFARIDEHIHKHRKPLELLRKYITTVGFLVEDIDESSFSMRFTDATAMFDYHFIRLYFLKPWIEIIGDELAEATVFDVLEKKLNDQSRNNNGLELTIPFVCFKCRKP